MFNVYKSIATHYIVKFIAIFCDKPLAAHQKMMGLVKIIVKF
jgi:hypothetical protein